jgi:hypothetical protein
LKEDQLTIRWKATKEQQTLVPLRFEFCCENRQEFESGAITIGCDFGIQFLVFREGSKLKNGLGTREATFVEAKTLLQEKKIPNKHKEGRMRDQRTFSRLKYGPMAP